MNLISTQPDFNWHERGIWIAVHPEDGPDIQFVNTTPWGCRAALHAALGRNPTLDKLGSGWAIQKLVVAEEPTLTTQSVAVSNESHWRYPAAGDVAPTGIEVQLLTLGGRQIRGVWENSVGYIAWAPFIKRDKELEKELGL